MRGILTITFAATVFIAGCTPETTGRSTGIDEDAARAASTVAEFVALGAQRVTEAEFRAELVDVTLDDGWGDWKINSDGTHSSVPNDKSLSAVGGTWRFVNGEYCRQAGSEKVERCSAVYRLGPIYRFTKSDTEDELSVWSATRT